jgi:hypothetical protein
LENRLSGKAGIVKIEWIPCAPNWLLQTREKHSENDTALLA